MYASDAGTKLAKQGLRGGYTVVVQRKALHILINKGAHHKAALPIFKQCALVNQQVRGGDTGQPIGHRGRNALSRRQGRDARAGIIDPKRRRRPAVVVARANVVEFIAALGAVFVGPDLARAGYGKALWVSMAIAIDIRIALFTIGKGVVLRRGSIGF